MPKSEIRSKSCRFNRSSLRAPKPQNLRGNGNTGLEPKVFAHLEGDDLGIRGLELGLQEREEVGSFHFVPFVTRKEQKWN